VPQIPMKESAIERTPVEIWRQIFQEATFWKLFPDDDDPGVKNILFFFYGCWRYHEFLEIAAQRGTFRLVSRYWNAIIVEMVHELAIYGCDWPSRESFWRATCIERILRGGSILSMRTLGIFRTPRSSDYYPTQLESSSRLRCRLAN
jgi:hypothetical protein